MVLTETLQAYFKRQEAFCPARLDTCSPFVPSSVSLKDHARFISGEEEYGKASLQVPPSFVYSGQAATLDSTAVMHTPTLAITDSVCLQALA